MEKIMKKILLLIISLVVLSGCTEIPEKEIKEKELGSLEAENRKPIIPEVGSTIELIFVKHISGDSYEFAYEKDGLLVWSSGEVYGEGDTTLIVSYDKTANESSLTREKNIINTQGYILSYVYKMVIAGNLQGGQITYDCGKNCERQLQTTMLDSQ
jgi:outer membrane lipoprotein-sorting protein